MSSPWHEYLKANSARVFEELAGSTKKDCMMELARGYKEEMRQKAALQSEPIAAAGFELPESSATGVLRGQLEYAPVPGFGPLANAAATRNMQGDFGCDPLSEFGILEDAAAEENPDQLENDPLPGFGAPDATMPEI